MTQEQLSALLVEFLERVPQVVDDVRNNRAPPTPVNAPDLAAILARMNAALPAVVSALSTHQGEVTGALHMVAVLQAAGVPYADLAAEVLQAAPGIVAALDKWVPVAVSLVGSGEWFSPAVVGIPGGWGGARGHA